MEKKRVKNHILTISNNDLVAYMLLLLGLIMLLLSAPYESYFSALIGLGLTFWGALLLYLKPTKYVKQELLTATASSTLSNIEKVLAKTKFHGKGIYLPPKRLKNHESSLVFIPSKPDIALPNPEETEEEKLSPTRSKNIFLVPPGLALSKLFEKNLGKPFTEANLNSLQAELPRLFEQLEITKKMRFETEDDNVVVEITNHIFRDLCQETRKLPRTFEAVGCPLSSAIACALAKATGKPIIIDNEEHSQDGETTRIQYRILED